MLKREFLIEVETKITLCIFGFEYITACKSKIKKRRFYFFVNLEKYNNSNLLCLIFS